jgi:16S rRNA (guanine966-N2)-methyltransferase
MRIIGGTHKGKTIKPPKDLPVRPTTDFAKEGLFNVLNNKLDFEGLQILDLFSGTGHISLEFASRGATQIISIDNHIKCVGFLKSISNQLKMNIHPIKSEVFDFLKKCHSTFDLIFADPPYELTNINEIHELVFKNKLLHANGLLIIEHGPKTSLDTLEGFDKHKKYGNVNFSFFENKLSENSNS